jgi:hypothetical protein
MTLSNQRALGHAKYMERRERLLAEAAEIQDATDVKLRRMVQAILQLTSEEMQNLIEIAQTPAGQLSKARGNSDLGTARRTKRDPSPV